MRISVLFPVLFSAAVVIAKPVFIEPGHDNSTDQPARDGLSGVSRDHLFLGRNTSGAARHGLISFNTLVANQDHATHRSAELNQISSRRDLSAMTVGLFRITATWCEDGSHPASEQHDGPAAHVDHATWIWTTWPDVSWSTPVRYSPALPNALAGRAAIWRYTFGSPHGLAAVTTDWRGNPEAISGWLLSPTTSMMDANRFHGRRSVAAVDSPAQEVGYSVTESASHYSGLRYDLEPTGEGDNVYKTPLRWWINLFDYRSTSEFLWVTADPVTSDQLLFGQMTEFPMLVGVSGAFDNSATPTQRQPYGTLSAAFGKLTPDRFGLDELYGGQATHIVKLVGIKNSQCL